MYSLSIFRLTCSRLHVSYASKFFCIKINPKVNEIRGNVIGFLFENVEIHIAIRYKLSQYIVIRKLHPIHSIHDNPSNLSVRLRWEIVEEDEVRCYLALDEFYEENEDVTLHWMSSMRRMR